MNIPLIVSSVLLAVGAALDGKSTIYFLTKGKGAFVEANKFLVWLYGTDTPSNNQVIYGGGAIIAAEIGIAVAGSHFWHWMLPLFVVQQLVQAGIHFYEWRRNTDDVNAYLNSLKK